MKICLITSSAPFVGEKEVIQNIAYYSWSLHDFEVIVFGVEDGVSQACKEYGFRHCIGAQTARNLLGVDSNAVILDDTFRKALYHSDADIFLWVNSDLILSTPDISKKLDALYNYCGGEVAGWARRHDLFNWLPHFIKGTNSEKFSKVCNAETVIHSYAGIDLFFWSRSIFKKLSKIILPFIVHAWWTDNYFNTVLSQLTDNYYEVSYIIKAIHPDHKRIPQTSNTWNECMSYNRATWYANFSPEDRAMVYPNIIDDQWLKENTNV